ncbi:MAG: hypothetical protein JWN40_4829 [Phycisphaerales bacterium]|nr:hypothetical protein [Phycisphaerales bacterium]
MLGLGTRMTKSHAPNLKRNSRANQPRTKPSSLRAFPLPAHLTTVRIWDPPRAPPPNKKSPPLPSISTSNPAFFPRDAQTWSQSRTTARYREDKLCASTTDRSRPRRDRTPRAKPRQSAPNPATAPVQNEPTSTPLKTASPATSSPIGNSQSPIGNPQTPTTAPAQNEPTFSPISPRRRLPFLPPIHPHFPAPNPRLLRENPRKTLTLPPARLAPISCPTLNPINPYINSRPRDTNHATFFPQPTSKPPLQKATSCCDFASSERRNKPPVAGDSHHA